MSALKTLLKKMNKTHLQIAGVLMLILIALALLWFVNSTSRQAGEAIMAHVYFDGDYRIGDGDWQPIKEGEHIPSTQGDVTLRGDFHMVAPNDEYVGIYRGDVPIAFYTNHISLTFFVGENEPNTVDMENPIFGDTNCGQGWEACYFMEEDAGPIEILVVNYHNFGNENAIDEMLANIRFWPGIEFEKEILATGETQRDIGIVFVILALMMLAIALFSTLIHIKKSKLIWLIGLLALSAGGYFIYSSGGISFWSTSVVSNTTMLGLSMMFYMLFLLMSIAYFLNETHKVASITVTALAVANAVFFIIPIVSDVLFYDTWIWWIILQIIANAVISACLVKEFVVVKSKKSWMCLGAELPLIAFGIDVACTFFGIWEGGFVSQCVFAALLIVAIVIVLRLIPNNINAAEKARRLEIEKTKLNAQLAESRISTMMSQIRPHFIYNTLGSIEQLCKLDPPKAGELVHNFAKYLRGNFGELDNPSPILMSQEMEHVQHYLSIENVRFPDMTFTFEMNSSDFKIPALTVQPIVENAIKHGLMKLSKGGTINVLSYETATHYCISVVDDGVGFDTGAIMDEKKHVGLRNIRERLKVMVNGTLEIESTVGVGTRVLVKIPKKKSKGVKV